MLSCPFGRRLLVHIRYMIVWMYRFLTLCWYFPDTLGRKWQFWICLIYRCLDIYSAQGWYFDTFFKKLLSNFKLTARLYTCSAWIQASIYVLVIYSVRTVSSEAEAQEIHTNLSAFVFGETNEDMTFCFYSAKIINFIEESKLFIHDCCREELWIGSVQALRLQFGPSP